MPAWALLLTPAGSLRAWGVCGAGPLGQWCPVGLGGCDAAPRWSRAGAALHTRGAACSARAWGIDDGGHYRVRAHRYFRNYARAFLFLFSLRPPATSRQRGSCRMAPRVRGLRCEAMASLSPPCVPVNWSCRALPVGPSASATRGDPKKSAPTMLDSGAARGGAGRGGARWAGHVRQTHGRSDVSAVAPVNWRGARLMARVALVGLAGYRP